MPCPRVVLQQLAFPLLAELYLSLIGLGPRRHRFKDSDSQQQDTLHTKGRYVVAVDDAHGVRSLQAKRELLWPVLESLKLSS
jgi:hypothetical protein